jgi:hypothetical protein
MKEYTIHNGFIYYGDKAVYALDRRQNAERTLECAQNVHQYLTENADISLLDNESIFDLLIFSCSAEELPYIMDAFMELNHDLKTDPDDEDYFTFKESANLHPCFGDVLVKWDIKTHSYICHDMGTMDLQTLKAMLR